jgi:predicted small lipoprotein YifL
MSAGATVRSALLAAVLGAALPGCGQRGPLVLPDDARPIQRLPQPPQPAPAEPQADDEERRNER